MNILFNSIAEKPEMNSWLTTCPLRTKCFFSSVCMNKSFDHRTINSCKLLNFNKGDIIASNYDTKKYNYIIVSGIGIVNSYLESGERLILCLKGQGQTFGELFHLSEGYPAMLQALTDVTVCRFSMASLLTDTSGVLNDILLRVELANFDGTSRLLWIKNAQRIYDRVKRALIVVSELMGLNNEEDKNPIILSHEDLAFLINTDRPSVTRALHKLEKEGFLDLGYQRLTVKFPVTSFIREPLFHINQKSCIY